MPTNKELEVTLNDLADRVYALEENVGGSTPEDVIAAVVRALVVTRSQGARRDAERLVAKYFPDSHVEDFVGDKFTTSRTLKSATGE